MRQPSVGQRARISVSRIGPPPDGGFALRDSEDPDGPTLFLTPGERAAFVAGIREENLLQRSPTSGASS
ncbi:MAG TPA: DUF397 domain-containing protein [Actinoplanes sp.]|nr:DUF397 domain-containing protein [Actinoplanes sp.]